METLLRMMILGNSLGDVLGGEDSAIGKILVEKEFAFRESVVDYEFDFLVDYEDVSGMKNGFLKQYCMESPTFPIEFMNCLILTFLVPQVQ